MRVVHYCTTSVNIYHVRYVVLTVVVIKIKAYWDIYTVLIAQEALCPSKRLVTIYHMAYNI